MMAGLLIAADRSTTNEKPSDETRVTYSVSLAMVPLMY